MRPRHDIRLKQIAIVENRHQIALDAKALKDNVLHTLATPPALAGSFGIGFAFAMLRCRQPSKTTPQEKDSKQPGVWLRLLLREALVPLALSVLQTPAEQEIPQHAPPPDI